MTFRYRHGDRPLEGYTILRGIGRGGFGEVYYAVSDGGREVALKLIQQNHEIELRGVRQCMNLKNPHLVTIFDVHPNSEGLPFVIMEHVKGPSLREVIRGAPEGLPPEEAVFFVREIAKGLGYLHEHGIVHRDLKPENIFYEDSYVKIGDYGLSKYISVSHQSGQTISVGTVHYMAPEIGSGNYHRTIDIYALGVIFYELLTGKVPFNGDSMGEILMKHLTCEPDLSPIEEKVRPAVQKALAKNPTERYGQVGELVDDLLGDGEMAAKVAAFNPSSLLGTTPAGGVDPAQVTVPMPVPAPGRGEGDAPAEPLREKKPRVPEPQPAPPPQAFGLFSGRDRDLRFFLGLATTVAMGLAVSLFTSLFTGRGPSMIAAHSLLILAGVLPVLLVEGWAVPRFGLEPGLPRRLITLAVAGPAFALLALPTGVWSQSIFALLAGLVLVDWSERVKPERYERVSLHMAFTAALCGFIVAAITRGDKILTAGILAAMSLVLNALTPFAGRAPRKKDWHQERAARLERPPKPPAAGPVPASWPQIAPAAPPSPPLAHVSTRLVRPRQGRFLAGVCAGLSARYGMDVVWVRLAFIFGIWAFGASPLIYVAFWICMPEEEGEKARAPAQSASRPRPVTRFFWFVAAALAFAGAVPCAVFNLRRFPPPQYDLEEFVITASVGVLLFLFSGFALLKARSRARRTFVVGTALPLLLIALLAVSAGSTFWAALDPQRGDEWAIAVSLGVASGVLAFFLGASLLALRRQVISTGREERPRPAYETHAGWLGLGMLLMTLAAAVVAGGTFLAVAGQGVLGNELTRFLPGGPNFARHGQHLLVAIVIFLPGLFCLLMARRSAGPAHIVRGAAGWIAGGVLAGGLSMALVESVAFDSPLEVHFRGFSVPPGAMIMMLLLGVVCGICLAWPARAAARGVSAASPTPERNEAW